ncbi:hypothetical protein Q8A73_002668 [Channa argus]|nr:hypothetical protein Q8A73_002668 [Channa argus]
MLNESIKDQQSVQRESGAHTIYQHSAELQQRSSSVYLEDPFGYGLQEELKGTMGNFFYRREGERRSINLLLWQLSALDAGMAAKQTEQLLVAGGRRRDEMKAQPQQGFCIKHRPPARVTSGLESFHIRCRPPLQPPDVLKRLCTLHKSHQGSNNSSAPLPATKTLACSKKLVQQLQCLKLKEHLVGAKCSKRALVTLFVCNKQQCKCAAGLEDCSVR